jgi:hypothetical protein
MQAAVLLRRDVHADSRRDPEKRSIERDQPSAMLAGADDEVWVIRVHVMLRGQLKDFW